jgi:hypothetical protein
MKSRLIFPLSVALIFLCTGILTYSQEKPNTSDKTTKVKQEKQVVKTTKPQVHNMKMVSKKTAKEKTTQKKAIVKTGKLKEQRTTKSKTAATVKIRELKHHKKMEKKSNTPQKK